MLIRIEYLAQPTAEQLALAITYNRAGVRKPAEAFTRSEVLDCYREACRLTGQYYPNFVRGDLADTVEPGHQELAVVRRLFPELEEAAELSTSAGVGSPLLRRLVEALQQSACNPLVLERLMDQMPVVCQAAHDLEEEHVRQFVAVDAMIRILLPVCLAQRGLSVPAKALAELPTITSEALADRAAHALLSEIIHLTEYSPGEEAVCRLLNYAYAAAHVAASIYEPDNPEETGRLIGLCMQNMLRSDPDMADAFVDLVTGLARGPQENEDQATGELALG